MSQDGAVTETVCMACNTLPHSTSNITTLILNLAVLDIYIQDMFKYTSLNYYNEH